MTEYKKARSLTLNNFIRQKFTKFIDDYKIKKQIGKGGFGKVYLLEEKSTGRACCGKVIRKDSLSSYESEDIMNEIHTLSEIDHPHIVKIICYYVTAHHITIVSEFLTGGELFDRITKKKHFSEPDAAIFFDQLLSAVSYIHKNKIVHRDIKPENIVFENEQDISNLKLIDFGNSRKLRLNEKLTTRLGTLFYVAPEVLDENYDAKCDVWSCGVVLFIMLYGIPPFFGKTDHEIFAKIKQGLRSFPVTNYPISNEVKALISLMLNKNPEQRPSAEALQKHVWFDRIREKKIKPQLEGFALVQLQKFHTQNQFQKAILMYFVSIFDLKSQKNQLQEIFKAMDKNHDGQIDRDELLKCYNMFTSDNRIPMMVEHIMSQIDVNENGCIDFSEFIMGTVNYNLTMNEKALEQIFQSIDSNKNAFLDFEEISLFLNLAKPEQAEEVKALIREADKNNDEVISFEEFKFIMREFLKNEK